MKRREFITLVGGAAVWPVLAWGQQGKVWRIGFLSQRHLDLAASDYYYGPFTQGLRELGYVEGRNLVVEWRSAEGKSERLPDLASDLARLKLDVLATAGTPAALAAKKAASTTPIVMIGVADPLGSGLVKSLARPGGNSTALSIMAAELGPKLLEILLGMSPKITRVAFLVNPSNPVIILYQKSVEGAAKKVGVKILPVEAEKPEEIVAAFSTMTRENAEALIVPVEPLFQQQKTQIVELTAKHRLPSIGGYAEYVEAGGLMSYGQNLGDIFKRAATYVDKILKGANPGELPVEQPTKFDFLVNRQTATTLGIEIPQSILVQATKVIE